MREVEEVDVVLVGAGIMSATLGTILRLVEPRLTMAIFERLDRAAAESSDAWNNAGTGHAGFCELNYTPQRPDGSIDGQKAVQIAAQFATSLAFWRALVARGELPEERAFLRRVPHLSFVSGEADVAYLRARHEVLRASPHFSRMEFTTDAAQIGAWIPLVMEGRARGEPVAATRVDHGTDVNFGALARAMTSSLAAREGASLNLSHEVVSLRRDGLRWRVEVRDLASGAERVLRAGFVFIGAGGYSLTLLEASGIPEAKGYGAFPVSGQWLRCTNDAVIARHAAKVYGRAAVGAPPMSVPHLDSRWIDGRQELLFGPYAGFTTKFLKGGSWLDLLRSVGLDNVGVMVNAGLENVDLTRYLVGQAMLSVDERIALLRAYYPGAVADDWEVQVAGLRVQIIKADGLKFGTEVVASADGTIAALLGASPGASTAVSIMFDLARRCFPERWVSWRARLAELAPGVAVP